MFFICSAFWVTTLIIIPFCHSACDKMYILLEEYFDEGFGIMTFRPTLRSSIDFDTVNIETNVTDLQDFDHNCIADIECLGIEVAECRDTPLVPKMYGIDERYITSSTDRKFIPGNKTSINSTISNTTEFSVEKVSEVLNDSLNETHGTLPNFNELLLVVETGYDTIDSELEDYLEHPAEEFRNVTDVKTAAMDEIEMNADIITDSSAANKTNTTSEKFGKMLLKSSDEDSTGNKHLATTIIASVLGGALFIAIVFVAKNIIMNYLHSATYHVPEGNR